MTRLLSGVFSHNSLFMIHDSRSGYAAIISLLMILGASLVIVGSFTFFSIKEVSVNRAFIRSLESKVASESGIEDAVYRVLTGKDIDPSETLLVGTGSTTILTTNTVDQKIIRSEGKSNEFEQVMVAKLDITTTATSFFYGAQIGEGGLTMDQNAKINGSIYSGGDIVGANGVTITGDVFVAVGSPAVLNESWQTQNTDVAVGTSTGAVLTAVDFAGDVGSYTSLVMGLDGFGRISYIDDTNKDLKFARCTNDLCSTSVLSVVDASNDINEVTSIALGSDGLERISYYYDQTDDLRIARCTNGDCSPAVVTTVDASGNMGDYSAIAMASDTFARVAYWDDSNKDVEFMRCTNTDCTTKVTTTVESSGNVGEYIDLVLGSDGFARMVYYDDSGDDLKFARCTDADCSAKVITAVDTSGDMGKYSSIALGSDGFARISYFDETSDNLKFARCTNADCTSKNINTIDSAGTVGHYTSLALASDGFARISYYDSSNGDLKFARCLNSDCSASVISRVDNGSSVGKDNSIAIGSDDLPRISYYASSAGDLKFARCFDPNCTPQDLQIDIAQSFQPTVTDIINRVELYLKKSGSPADATLRLILNSGASPSTDPADVLATGVISGSGLSDTYGWVSVSLSATPTLTANISYWLVIDVGNDNSNYILWGGDTAAGYARGSAKRSADWQVGGWTSLTPDLDFKIYMGGTDHQIRDVNVGGDVNAHSVDNVDVGGDASAFSYANGTVTGNINANSISDCTVNGNASYNAKTSCTIVGTETTPTTPPESLPQLPLPIDGATIQDWKDDAVSGGTCIQPECLANGDYAPTGCVLTLGPKKIAGNLILDKNCSGGQTITLTGTVWVTGYVDISNNAYINLSPGYADRSGVLLSDGTIHLSNNGQFAGSGVPGSYIMLLTLAAGGGHHDSAIDLHNNADGAMFYAQNGLVYLHNTVKVKELVGYKVHMENTSILNYESGLADVKFSSGPTGGFDLKQWKEVE